MVRFGINFERLRLLRHQHNTTFRVDSKDGRFALRINRPGVHGPATIHSEMAWLHALRSDTDLGVPEPIPATDGSLVVTVETNGGPRHAVLMRWQEGRFFDAGLKPIHLRRVGRLEAQLQLHASHWPLPDGFERPRVDVLTTPARIASVASTGESGGSIPSEADAEAAVELVAQLQPATDAETCRRAVEVARVAMAELGESSTLIHADLHYENVLFHRGQVRAIDFDDCGWGNPLYDLAVTLWELEERPGFPELRQALFAGYSELGPLPSNPERALAGLFILRKLQMLMWILESRRHSAFENSWRKWAREEIDGIDEAMSRARSREPRPAS